MKLLLRTISVKLLFLFYELCYYEFTFKSFIAFRELNYSAKSFKIHYKHDLLDPELEPHLYFLGF